MGIQKGSVLGDVLETFKEEGGKAAKEIITTPINLLEGLDPLTPAETKEKSQMFKEQDKAKLAAIRSNLSEVASIGQSKERPPQVERGETKAEKGQTNQMAALNNSGQGPQPLSANITPKKKMEPLVVQQKRQDKLHGAG